MSMFPGYTVFRGLYWAPADTPATFHYFPQSPRPQRGPAGRPTLMLIETAQGGQLQLGVEWAAEAEDMEALREYLADRDPSLRDPRLVRLSPAPVRLDPVVLELADQEGVIAEIASAPSSGIPPYSTVFSINLSQAHVARVKEAISGREGILHVVYRGTLRVAVTVEATISGDIAEDLQELGSSTDFADALLRLDAMLLERRLSLEITADEAAPVQLKEHVVEESKHEAAQKMMDLARHTQIGVQQAALEVRQSATEELLLPLESSGDIGSWYAGATGDERATIIVTGGADTPPAQAAEHIVPEVMLGFDPGDAPLLFVQVASGDATAMLRGPRFEKVRFSAPWNGGEVSVTTSYSDGGPTFNTSFAPGEALEWCLEPEHLGLTQLIVDGTALPEQGIRKARVRLVYRPRGRGSSEDRTLHLRGRNWKGALWLVTRGEPFAEDLEMEWVESLSDGSRVRHGADVVRTPHIVLGVDAAETDEAEARRD